MLMQQHSARVSEPNLKEFPRLQPLLEIGLNPEVLLIVGVFCQHLALVVIGRCDLGGINIRTGCHATGKL